MKHHWDDIIGLFKQMNLSKGMDDVYNAQGKLEKYCLSDPQAVGGLWCGYYLELSVGWEK